MPESRDGSKQYLCPQCPAQGWAWSRTQLNNPEPLSRRPLVVSPNLTTVPNQMIRSTQRISGHKEPGEPSKVI